MNTQPLVESASLDWLNGLLERAEWTARHSQSIDERRADRTAVVAEVHRSSTERLLQEPTTRRWRGDLVVGREAALLFANLDNPTARWQLRSPGLLHMELIRRPNPSWRGPWRPYRPDVSVHAFALRAVARVTCTWDEPTWPYRMGQFPAPQKAPPGL